MDESRKEALKYAVSSGNFPLFKMVWDNGRETDKEDQKNMVIMLFRNCGDMDFMKSVFDEGILDYNWTTEDGNVTLMHYAGLSKITELASYFKDKGLDLNARDDSGLSPILVACSFGCLEMIREMEKLGADINATTPDGENALHRAAGFNDNLNVLDYLIKEKEFDVNQKDNDGYTPYLYAARNQTDLNFFSSLTGYGADRNATINSGEGAYMLCCNNPNSDVVYIMGEDWTTDETYGTELTVVEYFLINCSNKENLEMILQREKVEKMMAACYNDSPAAFECLVDNSFNPQWTFSGNETVLMFAAKVTSKTEALEYLLDHGFDPNATDINGRNFLHYAASNDNPEIFEWLQKEYIDKYAMLFNASDGDGRTPSYYCGNKDKF